MAEENSPSTVGAGKSKQERIRDNQRRSRARRQEYLADLERRLSECHITCREADLQRDVFSQLQQENARLRELLVHAGVSPDLVESYVTRDLAISSHEPNPSLRPIKPKMPFAGPATDSNPAIAPACDTRRCGSQKVSCGGPGTAAQTTGGTSTFKPANSTVSLTNDSAYSALSRPTSTLTSASHYSHDTSNYVPGDLQPNTFDWLFEQQPDDAPSSSVFPSEPFELDSYNPNLLASQNAVLYSVAKDLIDRFEVTPDEMENIKTRLQAPSLLSPNINVGHDAGVNQQILFQILNELSTKHH